jgi:hypothetical protein
VQIEPPPGRWQSQRSLSHFNVHNLSVAQGDLNAVAAMRILGEPKLVYLLVGESVGSPRVPDHQSLVIGVYGEPKNHTDEISE